MAKNEWGDELVSTGGGSDWGDEPVSDAASPADSGGGFSLSDKPAAQQDLLAGVTPSTAGAGRGNAGLSDYRAKEAAQTAAPARAAWEDNADQLMTDTAAPAAKKVSVLEGVQLQPEKPWSFREASEARRAIDDMPVRRGESIATPVPTAAGIGMDIRDSIKNPAARGVVAGFTGLGQVLPGAVEAAADFVGADGVADVAARTARTGRQIAAPLQPKAGNDKLVFDIANSITQTAPTLIMGLGGGPAMTALFGQSAAQEYSQGRSAGLDGGTAAARAGVMAGAEVLGERFGFGEQIKILKGLTARIPAEELAPIFARQIMKEIPGEQLTTLVQFLGDKYGPGAQNPEAALSDYLQQAGDTLKVTIGQTAVMGGGPVAISEARKQFARPVDRTPQIEALRKTGDETAAALLEQRQQKEQAAYSTDREAQALEQFFPEIAQRYRDVRMAGAKTGDAVVQTAARWNFEQAAQLAGLSPKAQEAISNKLAEVPAEKAAGFVQKAITGLVNAGQAKPFDGLDTLAQTIETQRDQMLDSVLATMNDIESLEQQDAPQEAAPAAVDTAAAEAPGLGDAGVDEVDQPGAVQALSDINDVMVTPELDAVHAAATSPLNDLPEPTDAQKKAGNYKVGKIRMSGLDISIENPQGSERRGVDPDGNQWTTPMRDHYGYFKGTTAADGDKLDVFIKPGTPQDYAGPVFVVDQVDPKTGKFDEHKVVFGASDQAEAEAIYRRNYSADWQGLANITALPMPAFKAWASSKETRKPLGAITEQANVQNAAPGTEAQAAAAPVEAPAPAGINAAAAGLPAATGAGDVQADGLALLGQNSQPLSEGGKPFKTELAARKEKKLHPDKRVVKSPDGKGFILKPMSAKQIAAQEAAARRIRGADTGDKGPLSAHGFILARGGLAKSSMADAGFDKNVRIGNRWLFTDSGKTLAQAGQDLKEAGFITDETENAASDIIRRSISSPQYTAEGWEAVAEAEAQTRFEDHLKAQQESEEDPFASLSDDGYTTEDTEGTGFDQASPEIQAEVAALSAQLEAMGEDSETILERVALQYPDATQQEYHEHVKAAITAAVAEAAKPEGRGDPGQDDGEQGQAREGTGESLTDRPDGTLSVKGETKALRERLTAAGIPAKSILPSATGVVVGRTQAAKARMVLTQTLTAPTKSDIEAQQERVSRADELDARAQVKRESEAGADSFTLTVEDGRQDTTQPMFSRSADPLAILSETDDLYSMPKSGKDTIEGITADHDPEIKVRKANLPGNETMYTLTMPDGKLARITVRKSGPNSVYAGEVDSDNNTTWEMGRPGENPEDMPDSAEDVWIDVSNLKPGQNGARVYNIAATYAHNTGRIFIGDPSGLSDEAMRRRTEHMISSALKFGTTAHLAPHPRQTEGSPKIGVPALKWVYGDHVGNIERMIDVSVMAMDNAYPDSDQITYDLATGQFFGRTGRPIPRGMLAARSSESRQKLPGSDLAKAQAGWRTVARGAVFRSLLRGRGAVGDGTGRTGAGSGILDQLVRQRAQLASASKDGRIFYSRPLTAELFRQMTAPMPRGEKPAGAAVFNPSTVTQVQAAVDDLLGKNQLAYGLGRVVATTASEIKSTWEPLLGKSVQIGSEGEAGVAQGFYDPKSKTIFLISDHITVGSEAPVLAHELMHKHGQAVLGDAGWNRLHSLIGTWKKAEIGSTERNVYDYATRRVRAVGKSLSTQELFPYAVEAAIRMGVKPSMKATRGTVAYWLESVIQHMQTVWSRITGKPGTFKTQDLVDLAFGIAQMELPGSAADLNSALDNGSDIRFSRTAKAPASIEAEKAAGAAKPAQAEMFQPGFWDSPQETRLDRVIYEMADGRIDLKRVQEAITKANTIPEKFDARLQETLYPGRVATRAKQFLDDEAKPLLDAMARNNVTMDDLADYLHARHAEERNKQIAKVNPDLPDGGAGKNSKGVLMTTEAAKQHITGLSEGKRMVLTAMAKRVDAITQGTTKLLVDEGLEKQETIDAWTGAYKSYVPLFRDEAENGNPHPTGSGMSVRGGSSKRAVGSTKQATNILAHVLMQREAAITRAEKNRVAVALYGLALTNPNPDFWTTIKPGMSPEAIGRELQRMGVDPTVAEAGMMGVPTIKTVDPTLGRVVSRPNPMYKSLPGAIVLKVNGEDRVLMVNVNDPRGLRMAENLKNMDGLTKFDIAGSIVGKTTRWLASVNTQYNPAFGLVNLTRDTLGGSINLSSTKLRGKTLKVLAMTPGALKGIGLELSGKKSGEWGRLFRQFQRDGGQTGYREMFKDANDRAKALEAELKAMEKAGKLSTDKVAGKVLGALDIFNTTLENAVRLAAYREALQEGMSRPEAARLGRELTVDFNRKGRMGRELGPLYAFFNASVQGSARTLQTLAGPDGAKIIAGGVTLGVLQAVMLLAAGYDDDEIPEFVKSRALIIPLGTDDEGKKRYFTIPLPLGLHVLPNTGRVLAELTMDGGKDALAKGFAAVGEIAGAFNPLGGGNIFTADGALRTVAPTVIDPVIEVLSNKNFAGSAIEREGYGNDPRPGFQRAREGTLRAPTGQAYLEISRILNKVSGGDEYEAGRVSPTPEMVRYLTQVVGGGLLREIEKTVNTSIAMSKGEDAKPTGLPVFGRFYGEVDDASVQRSRYYDNLTAIEKAEKLIRAAEKKGDLDAADRIEADKPEAMLKKEKNRAVKDLRELNKEAMETVGDSEAIKALDEERTAVMRELNEAAAEIDAPRRDATLGARLRKSLAAAP